MKDAREELRQAGQAFGTAAGSTNPDFREQSIARGLVKLTEAMEIIAANQLELDKRA
ncbi:hypothetical protein [Bifidobacterium oedipodis]|uniref:hypothetical protein n=1 Tax=Bifidobacterium oedipodis TaxID=2675322 RepID=UPI00145FCEB7|nr:hypothetical protein [Bifidobacterium sp. DSM 109957]